MNNLLSTLIVNIGIVYLGLQTVYKYQLDLWYEGLKKPKFLPKNFCVQCFCTQFALIVSLITVPALLNQTHILTIILLATSTGGLTTFLTNR
jgi:tryptophan-rich sensory protein